MGENEKSGTAKNDAQCGANACRVVSRENGGNYFHAESKPDPYVIRARERAKSKLRSRMVEINGGKA